MSITPEPLADTSKTKFAERKKQKQLKREIKDFEKDQKDFDKQICRLCNREQPVFFYGNEDQVRRLPESVLTSVMR